MEQFIFPEDITVYGVPADTFPAGVGGAWRQLHEYWPPVDGNTYYGISHGLPGGGIYYMAAVHLPDGNVPPDYMTFTRFVIRKGNYSGITVHDFTSRMHAIEDAFKVLLSMTGYDPEGYCLERYISDTDVQCMVRLPNG